MVIRVTSGPRPGLDEQDLHSKGALPDFVQRRAQLNETNASSTCNPPEAGSTGTELLSATPMLNIMVRMASTIIFTINAGAYTERTVEQALSKDT